MADNAESRKSHFLWLAALFVVAFALRLTAILKQPEQLTLDRDVYLAIAVGLSENRGYSIPETSVPTAFRPPVYPFCLAIALLWFPPSAAVAAVNLSAGVLTVWFTAMLGTRLNPGRMRNLAAGLVAVDPLLIRYSAQPMTESLCTLLATVWIWSTIRAPAETGKSCAIGGFISGAAFGLLALCRAHLLACRRNLPPFDS